jgi:hypothetical protein
VADYPQAVRGHCAVTDEGHNRIYSMGGRISSSSKTLTNYIYDVVADTWMLNPADGTLLYKIENGGCVIITKKGSGQGFGSVKF